VTLEHPSYHNEEAFHVPNVIDRSLRYSARLAPTGR